MSLDYINIFSHTQRDHPVSVIVVVRNISDFCMDLLQILY